jgi:hypothetical protein
LRPRKFEVVVAFGVAVAGCSKVNPERAGQPAAAPPAAVTRAAAPVGAPAAAAPIGPRAVDVAMAGDYACARMEDGNVRCWGTAPDSGPVAAAVGAAAGGSVIAAGGGRACAVADAGGVTCWGATFGTQLDPAVAAPAAAIPSVSGARAVGVGADHACAVDASGAVWCWGNGFYGQLGDGKTASSREPVRADGVERAAELALGARHTCARTEDGDVFCWGDDGMGQLAQPGTSYVTSPHRKPERVPLDEKAVQIAAGDAFTCAVGASGAALCWGSNDGCALGDPAASPLRASAARVPGLAAVVQIAAGSRAACARTKDGAIFCWGTLGTPDPHCTPSRAVP